MSSKFYEHLYHQDNQALYNKTANIIYLWYSLGSGYERTVTSEERYAMPSSDPTTNVYKQYSPGSTMMTASRPQWYGMICQQRPPTQVLPEEGGGVVVSSTATQKPPALPQVPLNSSQNNGFTIPNKPLPVPPGKGKIPAPATKSVTVGISPMAFERFLSGIAFALGTDKERVRKHIKKYETFFIYEKEEIVNGFIPVCRLTKQSVEASFLPLVKLLKPATLDLILTRTRAQIFLFDYLSYERNRFA